MPDTSHRTLYVVHASEMADFKKKLTTTPGTRLHQGRWPSVILTNAARHQIMKKGNLIEWWEHHLRSRINHDPGPIHKLR